MLKKIIIAFLVLIFVAVGLYLFLSSKSENFSKNNILQELENNHPELSEYIKEVEEAQKEFEMNPDDIAQYNHLGLAWKGLADRVNDLKLSNRDYFYEQALDVYLAGVEASDRKNTLLIVNAGNMAQYLEKYEQAEDLYKEAIFVSPGDWTYYVRLADLYEYKMKKSSDEILAVYESGEEKVMNPESLITIKEQYLNRISE